jgi:RNA polymerase sigma-70 factor (ECF subfamily)
MVADHHRLFRAAHGILRDAHLAEDATQQAFLDIWRDIRRLRDPSRFEAWSYRLLVRVCYAEARDRRDWVTGTGMLVGDQPSGIDAFGAVADRDQLERGFRQLSLDHRTVVVLHHLLDMTLETVAETLDLPLGTVHSRLGRAMRALRTAMQDEGTSASPVRVPQEVLR